MNKRVVLINSDECGRNESRVFRQAISLQNAGYEVINIAYRKGEITKQEDINGVKTIRLTMYINKYIFDTKVFRALQSKISFIRYLRAFAFLEYAIQIFFLYFWDTKVFHCYRVYTLPIGLILKAMSFGRKKLVYDPREYESEAMNLKPSFKKIVLLIERISLKFTDSVILVNQSISDAYISLYNVSNTSVILNAPHYYQSEGRKALLRKAFNLSDDTMIFLYQGCFTDGRGIEELIKIFQEIKDHKKVIIFMGYGELVSNVKAAAKKSANIFYHEAVDPSVLLEYTASADVGLIILQKSCLSYYYASPNKMFEYMQAGLPIISSDLFEVKIILNKYKNGIVVDDISKDLKSSIESLTFDDIAKLQENINDAKKIYNWEEQEKVLLNLYTKIAA